MRNEGGSLAWSWRTTDLAGRGMIWRPKSRFAAVTAVAVGIATVLVGGCGTAAPGQNSARTPVPLPSPTGTSLAIDESNLLYLWPLSVDHGMIECRDGRKAVFVAPDGKVYALNREADDAGYADIAPLREKATTGADVSLGALRSHALGLCGLGSPAAG